MELARQTSSSLEKFDQDKGSIQVHRYRNHVKLEVKTVISKIDNANLNPDNTNENVSEFFRELNLLH